MITNIPAPSDYAIAGIGYLNLAADQVFSLLHQLEEAKWMEQEDLEEYWRAGQRPLSSALALVQQGAEFLLKSRIATVSPFLLISGDPRDWPSRSSTRNAAFSEFRTVDAQDLPRVHDTVAEVRLSAKFNAMYNDLRTKRNTVMHSVDHSSKMVARDILISAFEVSHELAGSQRWWSNRRDYLCNTPASTAYSTDHVDLVLMGEGETLLDILSRTEASKYLGVNKRLRHYVCPVCESADRYDSFDSVTAALRPNTPASTEVFCFVCEEPSVVVRNDCDYDDCRGNVLAVDLEMCLTCGRGIDFDADRGDEE